MDMVRWLHMAGNVKRIKDQLQAEQQRCIAGGNYSEQLALCVDDCDRLTHSLTVIKPDTTYVNEPDVRSMIPKLLG